MAEMKQRPVSDDDARSYEETLTCPIALILFFPNR